MRYYPVPLLALLCLASPVLAQQRDDVPEPVQRDFDKETKVEVYSGVEFQSFELGEQDAEKVSLPLAARVTTGRLRMTAQISYVRVTAPGNVVVPSGPLGLPILVDRAQPAEKTTREGLGDVRIAAAYDLPVPGLNASLNSGAKIPTASTRKGLGTGAADYWLGADVSKPIGAVTPFASVSYTKTGDPDGAKLPDTLAGQAGAALRLGPSVSTHLGYSYSQAASDQLGDEQRVFGGVNTGIGGGVSLGVYGSAGVAGPADVGVGLSLGIALK